MRESPRLSALLSVCCCLLTTTRATATAAAENSRAPLPSPFGALPFWRRHYLLANDSVQLEPCSAARAPRAWLASRPTAHGSLQLPGASGGPGASTTQGSGPGAQLPGTAVVQALIYAHQHPADCSKARFLVYQHPGHLGLGALLDYLSDALAWAWAEERVLLIDYPSSWTRYCHGGALALDECYFEPVSSCSLMDVYGPEVVAAWGDRVDTGALHEARKKLHGERFLFNAVTGQNEYGKVPPQAVPFSGSIIKGKKIGGVMSELFWWRAQGVAYICRLNARTAQVVGDLKTRFFKDQSIKPGTISMHIRRGNKVNRHGGGEMGFVQDATYAQYAQTMQSGNSDMLKPALFVSTEDPDAVSYMQHNMTGWQVQYTSVPRDNHKFKAPFAHAPTVEALRAFLNLDLALECDGWVGTLGSAWSTLTERLRSTVRCKADKPYTDAHGTLAGLGSV